jgi:FlaA1/EpsC-like NDP-sugar epimerase
MENEENGFQKIEKRILKRFDFLRFNYLKYWVVAIIDIIISVVCSMAVFLIYFPLSEPLSRRYLLMVIVFTAVVSMISFYLLKTYRNIIRYMTVKGLLPLGYAVIVKTIFLTLALYLTQLLTRDVLIKFFLIDLLLTYVALITIRLAMIIVYDLVNQKIGNHTMKVLIYGNDEKAASLLMRLHKSTHYRPVGFLVYGRESVTYRLNDMDIYHFQTKEGLLKIMKKYEAQAILFSTYKGVQTEKDRLIPFCEEQKIKIMIAPPIDEFGEKDPIRLKIRPIAIEDLLGREEICINLEAVADRFRDKTVFVSGAAGSIGSEFCRQVASLNVIRQMILLDVAETPMHYLRLELEKNYPGLQFIPVVGDVRHKHQIQTLFNTYKPQIVFHAAAYKHVPLMEENPCEAVRVNVEGTRIMAEAAVAAKVEKFIFLSSDKAVNPTNVMGATKRLAEMYVQGLGLAIAHGQIKGVTQFVTTRFGNVLGSNGSVIPHFRHQIKAGGPVTLTHMDITRYFMSISEASRLIMQAATISTNNEIMVFDMGEPVLIKDLAVRMIHLAGYTPGEEIMIEEIGLRPGEKLYEEVLSTEENSTATAHPKIRVAQVRPCAFEELKEALPVIARRAWEMNVPETVKLLKKWVPEFKSHNSEFEKYDKD